MSRSDTELTQVPAVYTFVWALEQTAWPLTQSPG